MSGRLAGRFDEAQAVGDRGGLAATIDRELPENVRDMDAGGVRADEQLVRDLAVGPAEGDEPEDRALADGEAEGVAVVGRRSDDVGCVGL